MVFWVMYMIRIDSESVVDIPSAHPSQQNYVHILGVFIALISVDVIDNSER